MTPPPLPPDPSQPPNPWQHGAVPARPSWTVPVLVGALATLLLHSPLLVQDQFWIPLCCTLGCSGVPVGFVPAFLASRRDPWLGPGAGFAVSFLAVGLGAVVLAGVTMVRGFGIDPQVLDAIADQLRSDRQLTEEEVQRSLQATEDFARFFPVLGASFVAISAGVCGAVVGAFAGRRHRHPPPGWPHQDPPPAPPPA